MKVWQDEAGNQWGYYPSNTENAQTVVIGSHLDTVPNGGKYDGIWGVTTPLSLIQYFHDNQVTLPYNLQLVSFADEEGTLFGATYLAVAQQPEPGKKNGLPCKTKTGLAWPRPWVISF